MKLLRQLLYAATIIAVAVSGATGGLDADTTRAVVVELLAVLAAGTALVNTPLPGAAAGKHDAEPARPTLTGPTIAGLVLDGIAGILRRR